MRFVIASLVLSHTLSISEPHTAHSHSDHEKFLVTINSDMDETPDADQGILHFAQRELKQGVACKFANGTEGRKCVGDEACDRINNVEIGCGSCNGYHACDSMRNVAVGERSCNGDSSCAQASGTSDTGTRTTIGDGSCLGWWACTGAMDVTVKNKSCNGHSPCGFMKNVTVGGGSCNGEDSCFHANYDSDKGSRTTIGHGSCLGAWVCTDFNGTVGNRSCIEQKEINVVNQINRVGASCVFSSSTIGDDSCYGYRSCTSLSVNIGDNSCRGYQSCKLFGCTNSSEYCRISGDEIMVGDDSCNGVNACNPMYNLSNSTVEVAISNEESVFLELNHQANGHSDMGTVGMLHHFIPAIVVLILGIWRVN